MNLPETPSAPSPAARKPPRFIFEPMTSAAPLGVLEALLKHPGRILYELQRDERPLLALWLLGFALVGMALYGAVVGTLAGGAQLWIAPAKLALGTLLSMLICLPSLYIFSCLGGNDARLRPIAGALCGAVCLSALLLIGFAPVAWIFSESTDSVAFMGTLHLFFWLVGLGFGLRFLAAENRHLKTWTAIFVVVCLQMTTTLRPIVGHAERFLPAEKKCFIAHWWESLH